MIMKRTEGSLRPLVGFRTRLATRIAPWLNHPNLKDRDYARYDMIPVPVTRQLIASPYHDCRCQNGQVRSR
jgi:hypothetical protein